MIRPFVAALRALGATTGALAGRSAIRTAVGGSPIPVPLSRGCVFSNLIDLLGLQNATWRTPRPAAGGGRAASHAQPGGSPGGVYLPVGLASGNPARLAGGASLGRRALAAPGTEVRFAARILAPLAGGATGFTFSLRIFAAIRFPVSHRPAVAFAIGFASLFETRLASAAVRRGGVSAALGA